MSAGMTLHRFTVRETSPQINQMEPGKPIYWHWSLEARSAEAAIAAVCAGRTGGYDQVIVPPLG